MGIRRIALIVTVALCSLVSAIGTADAHPSAVRALRCLEAEEASAAREARRTGEDEELTIPPALYRLTFVVDASLDGMDEGDLPISIETVCRIPRRLERQAAALSGTEGVALVRARTRVLKDGHALSGTERTDEVGGADTARLWVQLLRPARWHEDEDGEPVPTFRALRIELTD